MTKKLFFIAGEASGDNHTAHVVEELKKLDPSYELYGLGGPKMKEAGVNILFDLTEIAALGFTAVMARFFEFRKVFLDALQKVKEIKPDAVILTDFPGFNLRFAKRVKKLGIPVIYYVSPQVWAWKKGRIHSIPKIVDKMLVLFPFEKDIYKNPKMEVDFVGHPLVEHVTPSMERFEVLREFHLDGTKPIVTLVPGSRDDELKRILPIMADTAEILKSKNPSIQFLITKVPSLPEEMYYDILQKYNFSYQLLENQNFNCVSAADFSLIKSGTSTLEATLLEAPYLLIYKVSFFTGLLGRLLIATKHIGIANIIAGKEIVREFLQGDANPNKIAAFAEEMLQDEAKRNVLKDNLREVKEKITTPSPSKKAAESILQFLKKRSK